MANHSNKLANLLMVDDSEAEIILAEHALSRDKVHVNFASVRDGAEALQYLRKENGFTDAQQPDFVLLDLNMPNMPGQEVLRAMREDSQLSSVPVVVFSGSDADQDMDDSKALGAADYIIKPLTYDKLQHAVTLIDSLQFEEESGGNYLCRKEG